MTSQNGNAGSASARGALEANLSDAACVLDEHGCDRSKLLTILGDIQARYRYLPEGALRMVAERTGTSLVDVYAVATFYRSFSLKPKGKHIVTVCLGTACHVRGGQRIAEEFRRQLGVDVGETTPDGEFTLETANCLGACALGPVVVVDGYTFSRVRPPSVRQIVEEARAGLDRRRGREDESVVPIEASCPHCGRSLMDETVPIDGRPSVRVDVFFDGRQCRAGLSALYGSESVFVEDDVPLGTMSSLSCQHCRRDLTGSWRCPACGAPMAVVSVCGGATLRVCSRRGCKGRMLDLA